MARSLLGARLVSQNRYAEAEPLLAESYPVLAAGSSDVQGFAREAVLALVRLNQALHRAAEEARYRALLDPAPVPRTGNRWFRAQSTPAAGGKSQICFERASQLDFHPRPA